VIILGGENVVPTDVEEIVDHVPGIRYSAAVGVDSERTGTQRLYVVADCATRPPTPPPARPSCARSCSGSTAAGVTALTGAAGAAVDDPQDVERQDPALAPRGDDPGRQDRDRVIG